MPFRKTKKGHYVYEPKGKLHLPPVSPALVKLPGLKITWKTPVLPTKKPVAPKK